MTTPPNPAKSRLLFCIGAIMAAENEASADGGASTLLTATLRALSAQTADQGAKPHRPRQGRPTAPARWLRG